MDYVIAGCTAFLDMPNDQTAYITAGELWRADDPVVRRHQASFRPIGPEDVRSSVPVIEQATAAPGEKRTRTKPAA
jgi:hypothetical protein